MADAKSKIDALSNFGNVYNFKKDFTYSYKTEAGLTPEIVKEISDKKHEPEWMLRFRLKSLETFYKLDYPDWAPDISELDMDNIVTYVRPNAQMKANWNEVPDDIKDTFDRLGIPEAEKTSLAGVGAQYDSEVVYHSIQEDLVKQGVIYTDFDTALSKYEDIVKATQAYVSSFNGAYGYMKLLKYFIFKEKKDADGECNSESELLNYLEKKDEVSQDKDWDADLR